MKIEDLQERYQYWCDIAKTSRNQSMKKAARYMAVRYQRSLNKLTEG